MYNRFRLCLKICHHEHYDCDTNRLILCSVCQIHSIEWLCMLSEGRYDESFGLLGAITFELHRNRRLLSIEMFSTLKRGAGFFACTRLCFIAVEHRQLDTDKLSDPGIRDPNNAIDRVLKIFDRE